MDLNPFTELLLILLAIYLLESLLWLPRGAVGVSRVLGRWRRLVRSGELLSGEHGGLGLQGPAPFDDVVLARSWPVSLSADGVLGFAAQVLGPAERHPQSLLLVPWQDVRGLRVHDCSILLGQQALTRLASAHQARRLLQLLRRLAALPAEERPRAIRAAVRRSFDTDRLGRRLALVDRRLRPLRWLATSLGLTVFGLLPLAYNVTGLNTVWLPLLLIYLILLSLALDRYYVLHRRWYRASVADRWRDLALMVAAPTVAMRCVERLSRDAAALAHPLALVRVRGRPAQFRALGLWVARDLHHPMEPTCPDDRPEARRIEAHFRQELRQAADDLIARSGLDLGEILRAPPPESGQSVAFCPRCHSQFTATGAQCGACGVKAQALAGAAGPRSTGVQ